MWVMGPGLEWLPLHPVLLLPAPQTRARKTSMWGAQNTLPPTQGITVLL